MITFWNTMGKIRDSENALRESVISSTIGARPVTHQPYAAATSNKKTNGTASATTTVRILITSNGLACYGFTFFQLQLLCHHFSLNSDQKEEFMWHNSTHILRFENLPRGHSLKKKARSHSCGENGAFPLFSGGYRDDLDTPYSLPGQVALSYSEGSFGSAGIDHPVDMLRWINDAALAIDHITMTV